MIGPRLASLRNRIALVALIALSGLIVPARPAVAAGTEGDDRSAYVLLTAGSQSSTMSGSMDDMRRAKALRAGREGLLYVRRDGVAYVIREAATLRRAETIFAPQQAMGARQAELGSRQAAFGSRQAALGAQQARIGTRQAGASPRQAVVLGRQQEELGTQQDALGRQQDVLGKQQDALGREQDRLGRQAEEEMRDLIADAIRRGVARRVD